MGNFLTNLAKRSFTTVSGIRPHRASLFEPASSVPGTLNDSDVEGSLETGAFRDAEVEATAQGEPERGASESKRRRGERRPQRIQDSFDTNLALPTESEARPAVPRATDPGLSPLELNQNSEKTEENVVPLRPFLARPSPNESNPPAPVSLHYEDKTPLEKERSVLAP